MRSLHLTANRLRHHLLEWGERRADRAPAARISRARARLGAGGAAAGGGGTARLRARLARARRFGMDRRRRLLPFRRLRRRPRRHRARARRARRAGGALDGRQRGACSTPGRCRSGCGRWSRSKGSARPTPIPPTRRSATRPGSPTSSASRRERGQPSRPPTRLARLRERYPRMSEAALALLYEHGTRAEGERRGCGSSTRCIRRARRSPTTPLRAAPSGSASPARCSTSRATRAGCGCPSLDDRLATLRAERATIRGSAPPSAPGAARGAGRGAGAAFWP